ncbi:hypothetical protein Lal_00012802 [Lupinus albus]|nr:hypothetical protein Lal_00012802 [Lupinus albus]
MTTHLKAHNVWSFVDPGLQQGADEIAHRKDQLALSQIHQAIDYSIYGKIANAKTAKEAWDILKLSHKEVEKAQKSKLQSFSREYERILEKTEKVVKEEALKSQVNFNNSTESSRTVKKEVKIITTTEEEENYRGRGRGNYGGRGHRNFNQWTGNDLNSFNPTHQGRGGHSFRSTYYGRGRGQISIMLKDESQNFIGDVFCAPGLPHNLLSMGQLLEKSYNMQIHNGFCTLIDINGRFITKVRRTPNRLFPLITCCENSKWSM